MWHRDDDGTPVDPARKARYLILALAILAAIFIAARCGADAAESRRQKRICELVAGAGNCVRSGGEWVPRGSSPLLGP